MSSSPRALIMPSLVSMETIYDGDNIIMVQSFSPSDVVDDNPSEDIMAAEPFSTSEIPNNNNNNFEEINAESSWIIDEEPIPDYRSMLSSMVEPFFTSHGLEMPSSDSLVDIMDEAFSSTDEYDLGNYSLFDILLQALPRRYHTDMVRVSAFDVGASEFKTVPADDKFMASLKRMKVEDLRDFKVDNDQACSVCLEELDKDEVVCLLPCDHFFHESCIGNWLQKNHVCPLCRFELPAAVT